MAEAKSAQPSIAYLIHRIAVRLEDSINAKARKYGLRIGEIRVLMRILNHGHLSVGRLAEMTSIEPSALSHLLRRLSQEGWVTRNRDPKDNRLVHIGLTERGRKFAQTLQPYIREYNDAATKGIKAHQLNALRVQLEKVYQNIVQLESSLHDFPDIDPGVAKRKESEKKNGLKYHL
ncbi:MAG TPA: MarR family transcriptional regulator [Pseudolabrys sp.]|nr:MarR family transcriptional regulator [Pseudolabrys sp.]